MKANIDNEGFREDPPEVCLKDITIRLLEEHEHARAGEILEQEHTLGDLPRGRCLMQVAEHKGQWVALLDWGQGALKLADREEWIGWTQQQRNERLPFVVMNRRFLVMGRQRKPNLASRVLALATAALPRHWESRYGYRPLIAETFTDIEQFEGTCYKAAGWIECGHTRGFKRHRADFYQEHGRPKKLWLKQLNRNARRILTAIDLPAAHAKGSNLQSPERDPALRKDEMLSLHQHIMRHMKDPRRNNRTFPFAAMLMIVTMGLLAGRDSLAAIQRYGTYLTDQHRRWLGLPTGKKSPLRKVPSYSALRNLLVSIDPQELADCLTQWLQKHQGTLPRALAIDGKWIRDRALSLCLSDHETGAPVAIGFAKQKPKSEKHKREGELTVSKRLYEKTNLANATVTGDALYNKKNQVRAILDAGGNYFFQLKDPRRHAYKTAWKKGATPPLFSTPLP